MLQTQLSESGGHIQGIRDYVTATIGSVFVIEQSQPKTTKFKLTKTPQDPKLDPHESSPTFPGHWRFLMWIYEASWNPQ